ncbi:MAG: ATP-binding protein [Thermodesulfobacteriota bacterium]|nr:ATP-binding protein [Thermodesulfobacteriota bacterium]
MPENKSSIINIALVGGGTYCKEFLEKSTIEYSKGGVNVRFLAVAEDNPLSPGVILAKQLGLTTVKDYHELYNPVYDIHLIIIMTPEENILQDILESRPPHIRILSYHVFEVFWKAIRLEEYKLRLRNEEIETILNGIQDFILVINPEKEIVEVNELFLRRMKYARETVIGKKCYEVFQKITHMSSNCHIVCPLEDVVRDKKPCQRTLTRIGSDGETRFAELTIFPIWEKEGRISKFIEISRDITKRKREEEEITRRLERMVKERTEQLKATHEKLIHQDKIASLGKLSASVVHEINNPIAGVLNLIKLIKRIMKEGPLTKKDLDKFSHYVDLMDRETTRTSRIVSNLLAFSRQSKMEMMKLNLNKLIEQALFLNLNLLKINSIKVEKRLDSQLPEIEGSADQLQQVFMNILSNAAEAMESRSGGVLTIATEKAPKTGNILVTFKDTGGGMSEKDRLKVFEPFFTRKKKGKGVGLGLSVAYGIIQEHDGSISVASAVGKGTTFSIELPLKQASLLQDPQGGAGGKN